MWQWGITFWDPVEDSDTGGPSSITVRMEWNTYLLFNSDIVNFVWKTDEGEVASIALLFLFFGSVLIVSVWGLVEWGRKSYLELAEIASFSSWEFSLSNKHDTFWNVVSTDIYTF